LFLLFGKELLNPYFQYISICIVLRYVSPSVTISKPILFYLFLSISYLTLNYKISFSLDAITSVPAIRMNVNTSCSNHLSTCQLTFG